MKTFAILSSFILILTSASAQKKSDLPYYEIPEYPDTYSPGTVAARVIDGLGFRFYWATEGLRNEDLSYQPKGHEGTTEARTTEETLQHIYSLTQVILNTVQKRPTVTGELNTKIPFIELRKMTLENIKKSADILRTANVNEIKEMKVIFKREGGTSEFPFWNILNGPIDDAIWHVGQVITFRRSSGNPYNNKASVFTGKMNP